MHINAHSRRVRKKLCRGWHPRIARGFGGLGGSCINYLTPYPMSNFDGDDNDGEKA